MPASATSRSARAGVALASVAAMLAAMPPHRASADEPRLGSEPLVMREPGEKVDVVDAFDDGDPFDIHISLAFAFSTRRGTLAERGSGDRHFSETTTRLVPRIEAGLYKDVALTATLPIFLSDARSISGTNASEDALPSASGQRIAGLPFESPARSGSEFLGLGAEWGPLNQARKPSWPTLMFGTEVRLPLGDTMRACTPDAADGQISCAHPADLDRDGKQDAGEPAEVTRSRVPGTTRGTLGIEVFAAVSRRIRYVEPYLAAHGTFEIPIGHSALSYGSPEAPPVEMGGSIGAMLIPWENREHFGRVTFDLMADVTVRTSGSDFSELYDAIGSSDDAELRAAHASGVTHVAAYPRAALSANAIWQSSRYVKLAFGTAGGYSGNHALAGSGKSAVTAPRAVTAAEFEAESTFDFGITARAVVMF